MWVCVLVRVLHVCVHVCVCMRVRVCVNAMLSSEALVWSSPVSVALVSWLPPPPRPAPFFTEARLLIDGAAETARLMPWLDHLLAFPSRCKRQQENSHCL